MIVGVPKEIKPGENRVAMVPASAESLVRNGHDVLVEKGGGLGSGFEDKAYVDVGATIIDTADEVWARFDEGEEKARSRRRHPAPSPTPSPGCLLVRQHNRAVRRTQRGQCPCDVVG